MTAVERSDVPLIHAKADVVVIGVREGIKLSKRGAQVDNALDGGLAQHLDRMKFKAKVGDAAVIPTFGRIPAATVVAVGLGGPRTTPDEVRRAVGEAARYCANYETVALDLGDGVSGGPQAAVEGFLLGAYTFNKFKSKSDGPVTKRVILTGKSTADEIERGRVIGDAVTWARDLINTPAGMRSPAEFAEAGRQRAESVGLAVEILDEKEIKKQGLNGVLTVGQGSAVPPRFLILKYEPRGAKGFLGAIGKGITFDSGGLSLKPADGMGNMKTDCSGAADVIAAMCALPALKPKIKVVAAMPIAENMPGGRAVKPGDIIRHFGGRTSEVLNTDAEGRLVLADALAWMTQQRPDAMIDFATLTGGIVVALGRKVAGFFASEPRLAKEIAAASARTGERVWEMPLLDDLRPLMDSDVADIKNTGEAGASSIFGALFLRDFVGETPWVHVDIAGTSRADKPEGHIAKGATGFGTRLLIDWIENRAQR